MTSPHPPWTKVEFCRRLGDTWKELADLLDIEPHEGARFERGEEARAIWERLELRSGLGALGPALAELDRPDLVSLLNAGRTAEPASEAAPSVDARVIHAQIDVVTPPRPWRDRLRGVAAQGVAGALIVAASLVAWLGSPSSSPPPAQTRDIDLPSIGAPPPSSAHKIDVYTNWDTAGISGHAVCSGNPARPESWPGGDVTQTFTVPDGVGAINSALVQIDPQPDSVAHATLATGRRSATADQTPTGDTTFIFERLPVRPGEEVTLTISFSSLAEGATKIITVYSLGHQGGALRVHNTCPDGAPSVNDGPGTTAAPIDGLRAVILGDTG